MNGNTTGSRRVMRRLRSRLVLGALAATLGAILLLPACVIRPAPPAGSIDSLSRLDSLDRRWPGLLAPTRITWDEHLIPSIHAESPDDAAYALGIVHAHLRGGQVEVFRRVAQGRLSETAGPLANGIDRAIRAIDLGRAVPEMEAALPDETRAWIERYVAGLNDAYTASDVLPSEAKSLGFRYDEPWTVADVLLVGRLAGADVSWGRWVSFLPKRDERGYDEFIERVEGFSRAGLPSFSPPDGSAFSLFSAAGRSGSNAAVVAGTRSETGGALVASDPHLAIVTPGPWCVVGYRYGDHAVVGLTIPGLPFVVVGRNRHIAWTGTNMQSASSVLYELDSDSSVTDTKPLHVKTRFWFDSSGEIRQTDDGPIISDASFLSNLSDGEVVLRWRGHEPSDESTAFLRASQATDWDSFREAFETYAVGGQNMLFADSAGSIGQIMALEAIPAAAAAIREGVVSSTDERFRWTRGVPSPELPSSFNPPSGFLVSANNAPTAIEPAVTPQGNANDRVQRMSAIIGDSGTVSIDTLAEMQRDTFSLSSFNAAQAVASALDATKPSTEHAELITAVREWDGRYDINSRGAAAYQLVASALIDELYADRYGVGLRRTLRSAPYVHAFLLEDVSNGIPRANAVRVLRKAARSWNDDVAWGDLHRVRLQHPLGFIPVLGSSYRFAEEPWPGSTTTLYKSAHPVTDKEHRTPFGANARLLIDMADPDANRVVLLGGQDGRVGSTALIDQLPLWKAGDFISLPLTREAQEARAVRVLSLTPPGTTTAAAEQPHGHLGT